METQLKETDGSGDQQQIVDEMVKSNPINLALPVSNRYFVIIDYCFILPLCFG